MINIAELSAKAKQEGYNEKYTEAKVGQDIILTLLSKSKFNRNITIKGGVVLRSISHDARRATLDLDIDLIKYPLSEEKINLLIAELNNTDGIHIKIIKRIEDLKHQDYKGKRVFIKLRDYYGHSLTTKIDIGVHKNLSLKQDEYCFDIAGSEESVSLLINSKEQMFTEKLKSLLRFAALSTRFKDIYDIYYLSETIDKERLIHCLDTLVFKDSKIKENSLDDVVKNIENIFNNQRFLNNLSTSNKNWIGIDNKIVLEKILNYLKSL